MHRRLLMLVLDPLKMTCRTYDAFTCPALSDFASSILTYYAPMPSSSVSYTPSHNDRSPSSTISNISSNCCWQKIFRFAPAPRNIIIPLTTWHARTLLSPGSKVNERSHGHTNFVLQQQQQLLCKFQLDLLRRGVRYSTHGNLPPSAAVAAARAISVFALNAAVAKDTWLLLLTLPSPSCCCCWCCCCCCCKLLRICVAIVTLKRGDEPFTTKLLYYAACV
jgi:hypothetical protein